MWNCIEDLRIMGRVSLDWLQVVKRGNGACAQGEISCTVEGLSSDLQYVL